MIEIKIVQFTEKIKGFNAFLLTTLIKYGKMSPKFPTRIFNLKANHMVSNSHKKCYNVKRHRRMLWWCLILTTIVCIAVIPFFLTFIANMFSGRLCELKGLKGIDGVKTFFDLWLPWISWGSEGATQEAFGATLLPDFLGGMAGILVGFILDFKIIDKIKLIQQYESMLEPLDAEFEEILRIYHGRGELKNERRSELGKQIDESNKQFEDVIEETERCYFHEYSKTKEARIIYKKYLSNLRQRGVLTNLPADSALVVPLMDAHGKPLMDDHGKPLMDVVSEIDSDKQYNALSNEINKICLADGIVLPAISGNIVDDIFTNYENSAILHHIPIRYQHVEETLRNINRQITIINTEIDSFDGENGLHLKYAMLSEFKALVKNIHNYYSYTAYGERKKALIKKGILD